MVAVAVVHRAPAVLGQLVVAAAIAESVPAGVELRRRPLLLVVELAVECEWSLARLSSDSAQIRSIEEVSVTLRRGSV